MLDISSLKKQRVVLAGFSLIVIATVAGSALPFLAAIIISALAVIILVGACRAAGQDPLHIATLTLWGLTVFASEAAIGGSSSSFTPLKIAPLAGLSFLAIVAAVRNKTFSPSNAAVKWGCAYLAWIALCSLFAENHTFSVLRVVQAVVPFIVIVILPRHYLRENALLSVSMLACAAHVIYGIVSPNYVGHSDAQRLTGLVIANAFGFACAIVIACGIAAWQSGLRSKSYDIAGLSLAGLAVYGLSQTVGRTAALAVPIAVVVTAFTTKGKGKGRRGIVLAAVAAVVITAMFASQSINVWFRDGNQQIGTLTGRTDLWSRIWSLTLQSPIFGYGPGAMRSGDPSLRDTLGGYLDLAQAHNSFFEALLNSGFPGALLWATMLASLVWSCFRSSQPSTATVKSTCVVVAISSITLGNMAGFGMGWYLLLAVMASTLRQDATYGFSPRRASSDTTHERQSISA